MTIPQLEKEVAELHNENQRLETRISELTDNLAELREQLDVKQLPQVEKATDHPPGSFERERITRGERF